MWIFTQSGFISAVRDFNDQSRFLVRARDRKSLQHVSSRFAAPVISTPQADYPYRIHLTEAQLVQLLGEEVCNAHYFNYKGRVLDTRGPEFEAVLMRVWHAMQDVEDDEARQDSAATPAPVSTTQHGRNTPESQSQIPEIAGLVNGLNNFVDGLAERRHAIFSERLLSATSSLDAIGQRFGVTRERIRQLEVQLVEDLHMMGVAQLADVFSSSLHGVRAGAEHWIKHVSQIGPSYTAAPSASSYSAIDFLRALGYVEVDADWVYAPTTRDDVAPLLIEEWITSMASIELVLGTLEELGLDSRYANEWLDDQGLVVVQGKVQRPARTIGEFIFQELVNAGGQPVSTRQLLDRLDGRWSEAYFRNAIMVDSRFVRVDRNHWVLAGPGVHEYRNIAKELESLLDSRGPVPLAEAKIYLAEFCDVEPESVEAYARQHPFQVVDGTVQRAPSAGIFAGPVADLSSRAQQALSKTSDGYTVTLIVNSEHLRGSGYPLPRAVPSLLAMRAGEKVTLDIQGTQLQYKVTWRGQQATGSSLREILQLLSATDGMLLDITFLGEEGAITAVRMEVRSDEQISLLETEGVPS